MGVFEKELLAIRARVLEETGRGAILEISFHGAHDHNWPHGGEIRTFVTAEVRNIRPAAIVFEFAEYRYEFGNEIADPILAAVIACGPSACPPIAIVAKGNTSKALQSLLEASKLGSIFQYEFFDTPVAARAFLHRALG